jgi:hypothetical protein
MLPIRANVVIIVQGNTFSTLVSNMKQTIDYQVKSQIIVAYCYIRRELLGY